MGLDTHHPAWRRIRFGSHVWWTAHTHTFNTTTRLMKAILFCYHCTELVISVHQNPTPLGSTFFEPIVCADVKHNSELQTTGVARVQSRHTQHRRRRFGRF